MKVRKSSWHYRTFKFAVTEYRLKKPVSVCSYWSTIFIGLPILLIMVAILCPFYPLVWLMDKVEGKLKGRTICPIGRVEFDEPEQP